MTPPARPVGSGAGGPGGAPDPWQGEPASAEQVAASGAEIPTVQPVYVAGPGAAVSAPARQPVTAQSGGLPATHAGRHSSVESAGGRDPVGAPAGRHVLVLGGVEPLGSMITERLAGAGHVLAVANIAVPAEIVPHHDRDGRPVATAEPIAIDSDRFDTDEVVRTVARAEVALGGLDALVVLPASTHAAVSIDADAASWADEWSSTLTTEVLAAACACHIAARSFLARRRSGRIILVTDGRDAAGTRPSAVARAALARLGADLSEELGPHGIGVSVVTGAGDFGVGQVADVVEALLSTPVLSSLDAHIG